MAANTVETEARHLCIALEAVDDIANNALLEARDVSSVPGSAEVYFRSRIHQEIFLIRLLDFSGETSQRQPSGGKKSCLGLLLSACEARSFDESGSVCPLNKAAVALDDWLKSETQLKLWLPTLAIEVDISIARRDLVFILGNHVKHNLLRLDWVSSKVAKLLDEHGHTISVEQIPLALDDVRAHLQEDYFVYYGAWLAELVNNVRWGLQDYLAPVYRSSMQPFEGCDIRYRYTCPAAILDDVARAWFHRLMDHVRSGPPMRRFSAAPYLKKEDLRGKA